MKYAHLPLSNLRVTRIGNQDVRRENKYMPASPHYPSITRQLAQNDRCPTHVEIIRRSVGDPIKSQASDDIATSPVINHASMGQDFCQCQKTPKKQVYIQKLKVTLLSLSTEEVLW